jgi:SAM-dependent methyltransferase
MKDPNSCVLCGSIEHHIVTEDIRDYEYGAPGIYDWEKCDSCGLIRLNPLPDGDTLALAYPSNYHAYVEPKSKITKYLIGKTRNKVAKALSRKISLNGSILDIGCSTGELLSTIQTFGRFQLFGVEYNENAARIARQKGIDVWQGEYANIVIPNSSMDLVLMQHVLEHVYDPYSTLQKTFNILKPNGLVLGELPNFDSWDAKIFGRYWGGGHAPRHIFHFTPQALHQVLEKCGFINIRISPALHTGHWALSLQNWIRRNQNDLNGLSSGRTWYYPFFLLLTLPINILQFLFFKTGVMRFEAQHP